MDQNMTENQGSRIEIAALQTSPVFGDIPGNLDRIAADFPPNASIVVLPELCTTGYQFRDRNEAALLAEDLRTGPSVNFLRELAVQFSAVIVAGLAEKAGGKIYNSAAVITEKGSIGVYRKINLFYREPEVFDAGSALPPVVDLGFARLGVMICFDWVFPEVSRSLSLRGAQIIAHPSNLVLPWCQDAMLTRSLENRVFTVTANRTGREQRWDESLSFTGQSQITSCDGRRLVRAGEEPGRIRAAIDPSEADNKSLNPANDLIAMSKNHKFLLDSYQ